MKISYQAFSSNMTIMELFLKAILTTYFVRGKEGNLTTPFKDPFDMLLRDLLKGLAGLRCVIWAQNQHVLKRELDLGEGLSYDQLKRDFKIKQVRASIKGRPEDMFRDFNRKSDFIESVQKSMEFYVRYKCIR